MTVAHMSVPYEKSTTEYSTVFSFRGGGNIAVLLFIDSFSYYDHNTIVTNGGKFDNWLIESDPPTEIAIDGDYGRNSGSGLKLITNANVIGSRGNVSKYLGANYDTLIMGAAVKVESESASTSSELHFNDDKVIFSILDGTNAQVCLCLTPSMRLRVRRNGKSGLELGRSSFFLHEGVYYYIEFKSLVSRTSGTFSVRVDGVSRLTGTGNTQFTDNQHANGIRLGAASDIASSAAGRNIKYDDLYIAAVVAGSSYNDFIGDLIVEGRAPTVDRPSNQWQPSSGTLHYALVDDLTPNTTDYIRAGTVGYLDTFAFSGASVPSGSVIAVASNVYARKTSAGVVQIVPVMSRHGTATAADDEHYLTQEYRYYDNNIWTEKPDDSTQWALNFTDENYFGIRRNG